MKRATILALALAYSLSACSSDDPSAPNNDDDDDDDNGGGGSVATFALAGNVASCGANTTATAAIIDTLPSGTTVVPLGDIVMPGAGQPASARWTDCYEPTWGRFKARTRPVVGNVEMEETPAATAYFNYFGSTAGAAGKGWYSFDAGAWHVIVLNIHDTAPYLSGSEQMQWLAQDLAANASKQCTMVLYHNPYYLSSINPGFTVRGGQKHVWTALHSNGVDIVVNGGNHQYERFRPMDPDGNVDQAAGIRQFTSGVGGASANSEASLIAIHPNREVYRPGFGVLYLRLLQGSYEWTFISSTNPGAGNDSGTGTCH
jgi:hypothetical protein